jgi:hypothetical protein
MKSFNIEEYIDHLKLVSIFQYFKYFINKANQGAPKALFFAGSYYWNREKFFADLFSETVVLTSYFNILDFDYYYNIFKPDIVIYAVAEHALLENFFHSGQMAEREYAPVYTTFYNLPEKELVIFMNENDIAGYINAMQDPIIELGSVIAGREISFAYVKAGDEYYDLQIVNSGQDNVKSVILYAKTADIQNKPLDFIFISKEMDCKQSISVIHVDN